MHWLQLFIDTTPAGVPDLSDALIQAGALSITLKDGAKDTTDEEPIYEPEPDAIKTWSHTRIVALFQPDTDINAIIQQITCTLDLPDSPSYQIEKLEDQAWERAWLQDFHAMRFGQRLWVCPSGQSVPDPDAVNVMLDPGLAFGSGTHPTTGLCLEWLDRNDITDKHVIDYGCGSGILAIAAAMLGTRHVWAVDIDPQALYATRINAQRNAVDKNISTHLPEELPEQQVDILMANILANPLKKLAPDLAHLLVPQGQIILSGILHDQIDAVCHAYVPWFSIVSVKQKEDWIIIHATLSS